MQQLSYDGAYPRFQDVLVVNGSDVSKMCKEKRTSVQCRMDKDMVGWVGSVLQLLKGVGGGGQTA